MSQFEQKNSPNQQSRETREAREARTPTAIAERERQLLRAKASQQEPSSEVNEAQDARTVREATVRQVTQELIGVGTGFREPVLRNPVRQNAVAPNIDPTTQLPRETQQEREATQNRAQPNRNISRESGLAERGRTGRSNSTDRVQSQEQRTDHEQRDNAERAVQRESQLSQLQLRGGARTEVDVSQSVSSASRDGAAQAGRPGDALKNPNVVDQRADRLPPLPNVERELLAAQAPAPVTNRVPPEADTRIQNTATQGSLVAGQAGLATAASMARPEIANGINRGERSDEILRSGVRPGVSSVSLQAVPGVVAGDPRVQMRPNEKQELPLPTPAQENRAARVEAVQATLAANRFIDGASMGLAAVQNVAPKLAPLPETQLLEISQLEREARLREIKHNENFWQDLAVREQVRLETERQKRLVAQEVAEREHQRELERLREEELKEEERRKRPKSSLFRRSISRLGNRGKPARDDSKPLSPAQRARLADKEKARNLNQIFFALLALIVVLLYFVNS